MIIKAVSLYQPWATLMAILEKGNETRSWYTPYRGPIAIHAATNMTYIKMRSKHYICSQEPFRSVLNAALKKHAQDHPPGLGFMPLGAIVAIGNLVDCLYIGKTHLHYYDHNKIGARVVPLPIGNELAFGDYAEGRFAWVMKDVRRLPEPIPAKRKQGLWNWEVPEGVAI